MSMRQSCVSQKGVGLRCHLWLAKGKHLHRQDSHPLLLIGKDDDCPVASQVLAANIVAVGWNTYLSNASHSAVAPRLEDI